LDILSGTKAGTQWVARRVPFCVGRSAQAALVLDDDGVWDRHLEIDLRADQGAVLTASAEALTLVNGLRVHQTVLRNGDLIELGAARLRFGLSPTRQRSLRLRETLTWVALVTLCLAQVALIYWLLEGN
jgi:hypothetical protein